MRWAASAVVAEGAHIHSGPRLAQASPRPLLLRTSFVRSIHDTYLLYPSYSTIVMDYRPRYPQPFTLGEAVHLDIPVISEGPRAYPIQQLDIAA